MGEIDVGRKVSQQIPPGIFWRSQVFIDHPMYLKFNVSLSKDALVGIYGRRGLPPSHTQVSLSGQPAHRLFSLILTRSLIHKNRGAVEQRFSHLFLEALFLAHAHFLLFPFFPTWFTTLTLSDPVCIITDILHFLFYVWLQLIFSLFMFYDLGHFAWVVLWNKKVSIKFGFKFFIGFNCYIDFLSEH